MEQMKDYLEVRSEKNDGEILREKNKDEELKSAQDMQENLLDSIRDENDHSEKEEIKIYEKTRKNFNSDRENDKCCWLFFAAYLELFILY